MPTYNMASRTPCRVGRLHSHQNRTALPDRYDCRTLLYEYDDVIARRPQQTMLARAPAPQFAVLNGLLYIALIVLGDAAGIFDVEAKESVIGFSGVIFSMLVIYVYNFTYSENIRLYAMISAPTPVVPWLLFVLFMMVPQTSTLGRSKYPPLATDNLLENTDGVGAPHHSVLSRRQPAAFYLCMLTCALY